ncbi:hypothetical protein [Methanosarcina sp. UBA5]|uniref:hypothetical protein n=1 Tax=Methanosarcina sp. UBA5 TaxID=1915593 RepID=UPI0025CEE6E1|nr:hypothetical protein [Methanosarcina sp. UBA5]
MDLLKLINDKCSFFSDTEISQGLKSVILHLETAERHFEREKQGEDYLFTDVVYRSNQAFEGSLKEAYRVLTGNQPEKLTPYKIEQYLEQNAILQERVLSLFTNYREEWRNKSTHDYKLYFSEQEAFLAVVNICAFFNILLDQMIGKKAYDQEKVELSKLGIVPSKQAQDKSLVEQVSQLLITFSNDSPSIMRGATMPKYFERELMGKLNAYLSSADEQIEVIPEYAVIDGERRLYADFLVRKGESSLLIEIKNPTKSVDTLLNYGKDQLFTYINASGIKNGILYIPPRRNNSTKMMTREVELIMSGNKMKIVEVFPEKF